MALLSSVWPSGGALDGGAREYPYEGVVFYIIVNGIVL